MKLSIEQADTVMKVVALTGEYDDQKQPVKRSFSLEDLQEYRKFVKSYEVFMVPHNEKLNKKRSDLLAEYGKDGVYDDEGKQMAQKDFNEDEEVTTLRGMEYEFEVTDKFKEMVKKGVADFKFTAGDMVILDLMERFNG